MMEGRAPKGMAVRHLKRYASWVQNVNFHCVLSQKCDTKNLTEIGETLLEFQTVQEGNTEGRLDYVQRRKSLHSRIVVIAFLKDRNLFPVET